MNRAVFECATCIVPYANVLFAHVTGYAEDGTTPNEMTLQIAVGSHTHAIKLFGVEGLNFVRGLDTFHTNKANGVVFRTSSVPLLVPAEAETKDKAESSQVEE